MVDDSFLLLFNAHDEGMHWVLPPEEFAPAWRLVIDTSGVPDQPETIAGGSEVAVASKGMVVLQALAAATEASTSGNAAADVPTVAPVPVAMRAGSARELRQLTGDGAVVRPGRRAPRAERQDSRPATPATESAPAEAAPAAEEARPSRKRSNEGSALHLPAADHRGLGSAGRGGTGAVPA